MYHFQKIRRKAYCGVPTAKPGNNSIETCHLYAGPPARAAPVRYQLHRPSNQAAMQAANGEAGSYPAATVTKITPSAPTRAG